MIRWENGEEVKIKYTYIMDKLNLTIVGVSKNSGQIKAKDKTGSTYYIKKSTIEIIVPEEYDKENYREKIIIDDEDRYKDVLKK